MGIRQCHNIADLRQLAKRRLPAPVFHYIDGGADDELTLRRNTAAFDDYELLPSQLSNVSSIDTNSSLFGVSVDSVSGQNVIFTRTERSGKIAQAFEDLFYKHGARIS